MNAVDELESTIDQPLLAPHDHTLLMKAVHLHAARLGRALEGRGPLRPHDVLFAVSALTTADDKTRHTAQQVLSFLDHLWGLELPKSYADTLVTLDGALVDARSPMGVVPPLMILRRANAHERVPGFQDGLAIACDLIGDALETSGTMMTGNSVFGRRRPGAVAKACARTAVSCALAGAVAGIGPRTAAVVGGVAGSALAAAEALLERE
jgi:hypothetical protein